MNPAMRPYAARLILPSVLSAFLAAGCGGHPPEQDDGLRDASGAAGPSHLLSASPDDSHPLPTDDLPPIIADEAPSADPPPATVDKALSAGSCNANYDPCVPVDSDVDCAGGSGNGPSYVAGPVRVVGSDPYGLDRDGDRLGCDN